MPMPYTNTSQDPLTHPYTPSPQMLSKYSTQQPTHHLQPPQFQNPTYPRNQHQGYIIQLTDSTRPPRGLRFDNNE